MKEIVAKTNNNTNNNKPLITRLSTQLSRDEMETVINITFNENGKTMNDLTAHITTTCAPHYNKFVKCGYKLIEQFQYADGRVCGGVFTCDAKLLSYRNIKSLERGSTMTEEQRTAARDRMKKLHSKKQ